VILTRSPLNLPEQAPWIPFDLHVLSTPPAFILSQNQTLHQDLSRTEILYESESQMGDSNTHLTTTSTTGWPRCLLHTSFDERRVLLDQSIVARTGFWLSFFRFQGATTHATEVGGVKYTISGFLRRICGRILPATGMPTLSAPSARVQIAPGRGLCGGITRVADAHFREAPSTTLNCRAVAGPDRGRFAGRLMPTRWWRTRRRR
jgi:hypothetical protein